jgi:outer membrane lipoprotein-sorting protein
MWRNASLRYCLMGYLLLSVPVAWAQTEYHPVKDVQSFKAIFRKESAKVSAIESEFTQEKVLSALTEKIMSKGKFWFKRSDRVRIEYTNPYVYTLVLNGDKMTMRDGQKQSQVNMRSNKLFQQVNRIMIDCVQGTILDSKDFTSTVSENEDSFLITLTPVSKGLREFFETIALVVEKKDYSARSIRMNEPGGDTTTIVFRQKKLNMPISDAVFVL